MKTIALLLGVGLVLLFMAPVCFGTFNIGSAFGVGIGVLLTGYCVAMEKINRFLKELWRRKWGMALLIIVIVLVLVILAYATVIAVKMHRAADNPPDKPTTVVVLGCQVKPDGPGVLLEERIMTAKRFLVANPGAVCILSGGQGDDEPISEAECMRQRLVEEGIDPQRIYIEDKSTSTRENLEFSKKIIEQNGLVPQITVITNDFHQYRARKIAESIGMESYSVSAKTHPALFSPYYLREMFGAMFGMFIGY